MKPKYPAIPGPKGGMTNPNNDLRHDNTDPNSGGGPKGGFGTKRIPIGQRGGTGHQGRDRVAVRANMGGGRAGSGNPASRGGFSGQARGGAFSPEKRIPGHGGSPQTRSNIPAPANRGGFGHSGQQGVPNYGPTNPQPGAGNVSGRSARLIAGRFTRKAMGAQASQGDNGKYGSPPVTANT